MRHIRVGGTPASDNYKSTPCQTVGENHSNHRGHPASESAGRSVSEILNVEYLVTDAVQHLRECVFTIPAGVISVDAGPTFQAIHEIRESKHVRRGENKSAIWTQVAERAAEHAARVFQMFDKFSAEYHIEGLLNVK